MRYNDRERYREQDRQSQKLRYKTWIGMETGAEINRTSE